MKLFARELPNHFNLDDFKPANWVKLPPDADEEETKRIKKLQDKAMRDSWQTPRRTLSLAQRFIGEFDTDPFYNPWSKVHEYMTRHKKVFVYTGRDLDSNEDNGITGEVGDVIFGNGPFSKPAPWVNRFANLGVRTSKRIALVVPVDGVQWWEKVWSADLIIMLGRENFDPPPEIKQSSPRGAAALALWNPKELMLGSQFIFHEGFRRPLACIKSGIRNREEILEQFLQRKTA